MDIGHYYWGLYRDYYRDPFPHSLPSTRQTKELRVSSNRGLATKPLLPEKPLQLNR